MIGLIAITTTILAAISDADRKKQATVAFALGGFQGLVDAGHLDLARKMMVHKMQSSPNWPNAVVGSGEPLPRDEVYLMLVILNKGLETQATNKAFFRYYTPEHGIQLIKIYRDGDKESELVRLWPAPGWTVEPKQDLYVTYISDGYLSGADRTYELPDSLSEHHEWSVYKVEDVPFTLAERILLQGRPDQFFDDGYTAATELSSYPAKLFATKQEETEDEEDEDSWSGWEDEEDDDL